MPADTRPTVGVDRTRWTRHASAAIVTSLVKFDSWHTHSRVEEFDAEKLQLTRDGNYSTVNAQMQSELMQENIRTETVNQTRVDD